LRRALLGRDQARAIKPIGLGDRKLVARLGLVVGGAVEAEMVPRIVRPVVAVLAKQRVAIGGIERPDAGAIDLAGRDQRLRVALA
jgi:hypothetical protein